MRPLALLLAVFLGATSARALDLWVYTPTNLLVTENVDKLLALYARAAKAGYTKALIADAKFARIEEMVPPNFGRYRPNLERLKKGAADLGIELVPALFSVGYSNDLLMKNPNLIEGPPVRDALFVVKGNEARHQPEHPQPLLRDGGFADLKKWQWHDEMVSQDQGGIVMTDPKERNARISQTIAVKPWRQYHVTVWIKTEDFRGTPEIKLLSPKDGRSLAWDYLKVERTQDWKLHHAVFNSLDNDKLSFYLGAWGAGTGKVWWKDAKVEEVGLVNLIRRPGAPFSIRTEDGRELREGVDVEPVSDPLCGTKPYAGCYDVYHEPPVIRLKAPLPDGTRLRVSYYHGVTVYDGQAMIDISEPQTLELLREQARHMVRIWGAKSYWMSHDEIRVLGWSESFRNKGLTPGQLLAENARACVGFIREFDPKAEIHVWNDMFDPHHNAVKGPYYLVNGSYEGSWEGLDPQVIIGNWHHGKRDANLPFFANRGHRQVIAAYYDGPLDHTRQWLASAAKVKGVQGIMYTTWRNDYSKLEEFAEVVKAK